MKKIKLIDIQAETIKKINKPLKLFILYIYFLV